MLASITNIIT